MINLSDYTLKQGTNLVFTAEGSFAVKVGVKTEVKAIELNKQRIANKPS